MILNCAIVDDEPLALELLKSYVEKTSFLRVGREVFQCGASYDRNSSSRGGACLVP